MNNYAVEKLEKSGKQITVCAPASKSILNRALLLAALSKQPVFLSGGELSGDTRAFFDCLTALGVRMEQRDGGIAVHGCGGSFPNRKATVNVQSAGTAARFLTVALAFCGGEYLLTSSEQMKKRPMAEVISLLRSSGVEVTCLEQEGRFPFRICSKGIDRREFSVDTDKSSQYASAILLTAGCLSSPLTLTLTGSRTEGSYIGITLKMLSDFHVPYQREGNRITVYPQNQPPKTYAVEPDVSGACYFYSLALLLQRRVLVKGVFWNSMQGDVKYLRLLEGLGVRFCEEKEGLLADGTKAESFAGFDEDMQDYSDQTLTACAIASFATSPSVIRNVAHIRLQECDRIRAAIENLNALGVCAHSDGENIFISPSPIKSATIHTFDDHRVAMAFALVGLRVGGVQIENPDCCKKTFENYFELLSELE